MTEPWTQGQALVLCREIEAIAPEFGCHVALTGGLLYKDGPRKDADILFYRIRQVDEIDVDGLFEALAGIGVDRAAGFGWCIKATYQGRAIDCFFPEQEGEYPTSNPDDLHGWTEEDIMEEVRAMESENQVWREERLLAARQEPQS